MQVNAANAYGLSGFDTSYHRFAVDIAPKRVARRMGFDHGQPLDTFNYWHYTTDYWVISARDTQFTSVSFDKASMIRWESELLKESYCTYTGYAFKPRRYRGAVPTSTGIEYQAELQLLAQERQVRMPPDRARS